jgi:hypothetical protein
MVFAKQLNRKASKVGWDETENRELRSENRFLASPTGFEPVLSP